MRFRQRNKRTGHQHAALPSDSLVISASLCFASVSIDDENEGKWEIFRSSISSETIYSTPGPDGFPIYKPFSLASNLSRKQMFTRYPLDEEGGWLTGSTNEQFRFHRSTDSCPFSRNIPFYRERQCLAVVFLSRQWTRLRTVPELAVLSWESAEIVRRRTKVRSFRAMAT